MGDKKEAEAMTRNPWGVRVCLQSLAISLSFVLVVAAIANEPHCSALWVVLLPGAFLAAIFFPQGVNSYGGNAYLVVAGLLDIALFALFAMWILNRLEHWKKLRR